MSNASVRLPGAVDSSGGAELEPMGMDAGAFHLIAPPPPNYRPPLKEARDYPGFADSTSSQCRVDGIDMPCGMASSEATVACPNNDCGPRAARDSKGQAVGIVVFDANAYLDNRGVGGNAGFIPASSTYTGNGNFVGGTFQGGEDVAVQFGFWEGGLPSGRGNIVGYENRFGNLAHGNLSVSQNKPGINIERVKGLTKSKQMML